MEPGDEFPQKYDTKTHICEMTIEETFLEDQGVISCQAINKYGDAVTSCYLSVVGKTILPNCLSRLDIN